MKKSKYQAQTVEQFHIMKWIQENFRDEGLLGVQLIDRDHVRILDRTGGQAILSYRNGEVTLREIDAAC